MEEYYSSKLSQQTVLSGRRIVWVELSRGRFVGGQVVKASGMR